MTEHALGPAGVPPIACLQILEEVADRNRDVDNLGNSAFGDFVKGVIGYVMKEGLLRAF